MVSATESELVSDSPLSLTCSIQPSSVDTPTTVMSSWTAPNHTVNATSVELMISSVETADSGDYICSVRVTDSSGSEYVVDSEPETDSVNIVVSKFYWRSSVNGDHSTLLSFDRSESDYQTTLCTSSRGGP